MSIGDTWYRYWDHNRRNPTVFLKAYTVKRETKACVILDIHGQEKRVLKEARKRFAYPTVELAKQSFIIRKRSQLRHVSEYHDYMHQIISMIEDDSAFDSKQQIKKAGGFLW